MNPRVWTIKELLKVTAAYLKEKKIDAPRLSAEILLAHQLKTDRIKLYLNFDQPLHNKEIDGYRSLVRRRVNREPIQHITGTQEFWSLDFVVGPAVLIPRPETEILVEQVIGLVDGELLPDHENPHILDLGTGCGALSIALAKEVEKATLWAGDISEKALDVARLNAKKHGVEERIDFGLGDLWQPFKGKGLRFDVILSNPPYIPTEKFESLQPEVRDYEPRVALDGHEGGMYYIERIIREGLSYLKPKGWILLEMDPEQTPEAMGLVEAIGSYGELKRIKDYSNRYRVLMAQKNRS